jgi:polysaccharide deacetylase family protein (PEP-CTERM system associated)
MPLKNKRIKRETMTELSQKKHKNVMSVDVEEYFHVQALNQVVSRQDWDRLPLRGRESMEHLLELFAIHSVKATFFTLGWFAEKNPGLMRKMADKGHEIACHSYDHKPVYSLTPKTFKADIEKARKTLEDATSAPVIGYRAPTFSINENTPWAYEILAEAGFTYSSSIYPVKHDLYGNPNAPRGPTKPLGENVNFYEIPMSTLSFFGKNIPVSGGGYFRLIPYALYRKLLELRAKRENTPHIFYTHPWEIDPDQPVIKGLKLKSRFRHYYNLGNTYHKLEKLCHDFDWGRMDDVYLKTKEF